MTTMIDLTSTAVLPTPYDQSKNGSTMLLQEALARTRMREAEQAARDHRQARSVTAGRTWQKLARWTARRAARATIEL